MTTPVAELPTTLAEARALILALAEERAAIEAVNSRMACESATLIAAKPVFPQSTRPPTRGSWS
ncbi:hypothetical protein [Bradyrhizobium sp. DN5]|uniref:hypothetical protein n=1 Tax=Bradyrhizobium sp. DN5 TaxID=3056950 RepID=UPI003523B67B